MGNKMRFLLDYYQYMNDIEKLSNNDDIKIYNEIENQSKFGRLVLTEGLITTHSILKSIDIISKRFPNLIVQSEKDGEIYIEGEFEELGMYLPLFTNLGYFISTYTINGNEWLKEYNIETKPIAIYLEPKYDYKIDNIPKLLYHASPLKFKNKILKYGLSPRTGNKIANHPDRIYLTDSIENAYNFGVYLKNDNNTYYEDGFCIYLINSECIYELYSDINFREGGYYTLNNISPNYIKLIKEITK